MNTNSCLKDMCCVCEHFRATRNEFDKTFICSCILYKKGIVVSDVTLITPAAMLNSINWEDIK